MPDHDQPEIDVPGILSGSVPATDEQRAKAKDRLTRIQEGLEATQAPLGVLLPPDFLEKSRRAAPTSLQAASVYALQGILSLLIHQHLQMDDLIQQSKQADVLAEEQADDDQVPNPVSECASGHEFITRGCEDCAKDLEDYQHAN